MQAYWTRGVIINEPQWPDRDLAGWRADRRGGRLPGTRQVMRSQSFVPSETARLNWHEYHSLPRQAPV